jgi:hypothetical protein
MIQPRLVEFFDSAISKIFIFSSTKAFLKEAFYFLFSKFYFSAKMPPAHMEVFHDGTTVPSRVSSTTSLVLLRRYARSLSGGSGRRDPNGRPSSDRSAAGRGQV